MKLASRLVFFALALASAFACTGEEATDGVTWIREPLEAVWVSGDEAPSVLYTVSYDSRDTHRTALVIATAGDAVGFNEGSASDANGNAPAVPGDEVSSAFGMWSPRAVRVGDRSFVFVIVVDADGSRRLQRISWMDDPTLATEGALPGTNGARAFDVAVLGDRLYVATVTSNGDAAAIRLVVLDGEGDAVGDPLSLAAGVSGLVQGVWLSLGEDGDDVTGHVVLQSCEGCAALDYDDWESACYDVTGLFHAFGFTRSGEELTVDDEPRELLRWDALVERARAVRTGEGLAFSYWRMAEESFPGCMEKGHCPLARTLVFADWQQGAAVLVERSELSSSELAYLQTVDVRDGEPWVFWRERDESDRWLRGLVAARLDEDGGLTERFDVTDTHVALMLADEWGGAADRLPYEYVDSLATRAADDGMWVAMRYRDLPPGATQVCGEDVRVGIWTARLAPDGTLLQQSEDRSELALEAECGGGGCSVGGGGSLPLWLVVLAVLTLRRRWVAVVDREP